MLQKNTPQKIEMYFKIYSVLKAITGSFLLAILDCISPDITVSIILIATSTKAGIIGT